MLGKKKKPERFGLSEWTYSIFHSNDILKCPYVKGGIKSLCFDSILKSEQIYKVTTITAAGLMDSTVTPFHST